MASVGRLEIGEIVVLKHAVWKRTLTQEPRGADPLRREPAPAKETAATESRLATEQEEA